MQSEKKQSEKREKGKNEGKRGRKSGREMETCLFIYLLLEKDNHGHIWMFKTPSVIVTMNFH